MSQTAEASGEPLGTGEPVGGDRAIEGGTLRGDPPDPSLDLNLEQAGQFSLTWRDKLERPGLKL